MPYPCQCTSTLCDRFGCQAEIRSVTGWPPGMLQDDSRKLTDWFASKPDAMRLARESADDIKKGSECSQHQQ